MSQIMVSGGGSGGSGTVTSITEGTGITLTPNPITSTGSIALTVPVSLANGGTNADLTASDGGIFYSTASAGAILSGTSTADQVLLSGSSTTPAWSTATYPATVTASELLYASSSNVIGQVTLGDYGVLISSSAGVPSWLANGTTGQVLTATTSGTPSWEAAASGGITTLDADSGSCTGTTVTISGGSTGLTTTASSATMDLTGTLKLANGGTNADLTASNGGIFYSTSTAGAILSGTATADQVLLSGSSTTPAWSTATYPATVTASELLYASATNVIGQVTVGDYGVLISSSSGVPSWLANGTTGKVLTATTSGTPSWGSAPIITIDGDSGSVTGSTITFNANSNAGSTVFFAGSSATMDLTVSDSNNNTFIGKGAGKSGTSNSQSTGIGSGALSSITSGGVNTALGYNALKSLSTGDWNVAIGDTTLAALTTTNQNCALGHNAATNLVTGANSCFFGSGTGNNYTGAESSNIIIGYLNGGTLGESNVLRIGNGTGTSGGNLNAAYVSGITGIVVTGSAVLISSGNQLGVAASSKRFKNDIQDMKSDSDALLNLRPVTFIWNKESSSGLKDATADRQYGLIAEEVHQIMPQLVNYDKKGNPFSVKYQDLPAMLLNELQKVKKELDDLREIVNGIRTNSRI